MNDQVLDRPLSSLHRDVIARNARAALDRTTLNFLGLAKHLNSGNPAVSALLNRVSTTQAAAFGGDAAHGHAAALKALWSLALREAQTQTYADACFVIMLCFVIAIAMVPLMRKVTPMAGPSADAH